LTNVLTIGTIVVNAMTPNDHFADNLKRLAGMHDLPLRDVAMLIEASESVVNKWQSGDRNPSFTFALKVGDLFQVDPGKLARMSFDELLEQELTAERYRKAEAEIERLKREWEGKPAKVVQIQKGRRKKEGR
jgi:transcriptional regulator with XRE-family HTH domain